MTEKFNVLKLLSDMEDHQFDRFMLVICFCWLTGAVTCYLNSRLEQETKVKMAEIQGDKAVKSK